MSLEAFKQELAALSTEIATIMRSPVVVNPATAFDDDGTDNSTYWKQYDAFRDETLRLREGLMGTKHGFYHGSYVEKCIQMEPHSALMHVINREMVIDESLPPLAKTLIRQFNAIYYEMHAEVLYEEIDCMPSVFENTVKCKFLKKQVKQLKALVASRNEQLQFAVQSEIHTLRLQLVAQRLDQWRAAHSASMRSPVARRAWEDFTTHVDATYTVLGKRKCRGRVELI